MKKCLQKIEKKLINTDNCINVHDGIYGDASNIYGNASNIKGDVSRISGNIDNCELTEITDVQDLINHE